jgi:hypothetical protein
MKSALFTLCSLSFSVRFMVADDASPWQLVAAAVLLGYAWVLLDD